MRTTAIGSFAGFEDARHILNRFSDMALVRDMRLKDV